MTKVIGEAVLKEHPNSRGYEEFLREILFPLLGDTGRKNKNLPGCVSGEKLGEKFALAGMLCPARHDGKVREDHSLRVNES